MADMFRIGSTIAHEQLRLFRALEVRKYKEVSRVEIECFCHGKRQEKCRMVCSLQVLVVQSDRSRFSLSLGLKSGIFGGLSRPV